MSKKVMELVDKDLGIKQCKVCGAVKGSCVKNGRAVRGSWQCQYGCVMPARAPITKSEG